MEGESMCVYVGANAWRGSNTRTLPEPTTLRGSSFPTSYMLALHRVPFAREYGGMRMQIN